MPYKFEKEKLKMKTEDKSNIKLSLEDKAQIRKMYLEGNFSQRQLAKMFNVSRSTIVFAIYPDRYQKSRQQFKERQKTGRYYDKEKQSQYTKKYRKKKYNLYLDNKLS